MHENQRQLKNFLINPTFQVKFIFWVSGTGFALILLLSAVFYFFINENYMLLVELSDLTEEARNQLYYELKQIVAILSAICFVFVGVTSLLGVVLSHRIVGPLYKLRLTMEEVKAGDLEKRVYFRPKDNFQDLASDFNKMMDSIQACNKDNANAKGNS